MKRQIFPFADKSINKYCDIKLNDWKIYVLIFTLNSVEKAKK